MEISQKKYSAGAVKAALWFLPFRQAALLLAEGKAESEIKALSTEENIFGFPSSARGKEILNTVLRRLRAMGETFPAHFAATDSATQRLLSLAAAMADDRLLLEFVYEILRGNLLLGSSTYAPNEISRFFDEKKRQDKTIAGWTDATLRRLGQSYRNMTADAGLTDASRGKRQIFPAILPTETETWMKTHGFTPIWQALTGERL